MSVLRLIEINTQNPVQKCYTERLLQQRRLYARTVCERFDISFLFEVIHGADWKISADFQPPYTHECWLNRQTHARTE